MSGRAVHDRVDPHGTHANLWNAAATGANGLSAIVRVFSAAVVAVFGNTSGASTLTLQYSADGTNFYDSGDTIAANGDFGKTFTVGAGYLRVKSGSAVTATATLQAK